MTSYTAIGGGQTPSMTVNFKMNITTYGPHNGIFITSGIQQGTSGAGFFAAHTTPSGTIIAPSIPAIQELPTSLRGSSVSVGGVGSGRTTIVKGDKLDFSRSRSTSRSRPSSPLIDFYGGGRDSPPDEFIEPEKVKLNVFNEEKPFVQYPTDLLLNDTKTTTTTVEVFRSKVDGNNPVDFFELPPNPLGSDPRSQLIRASGPPYEVVTRAETRFSDRPEYGSTSPLPRAVQWGSRTSGLASSHSPSNGYGSLERTRPVSQTIQRQDWIDERDGAYQTMITRRQFSDQQEQKLQRQRQRTVYSPTQSTTKVYPITVERDYFEERRQNPRPLRYTTSQPNVFEETPLNRSLDDSYRITNPRYTTTYPHEQQRLRRARSRSETRSDDYYYDRNRPYSGLSNLSRADSWSNSVNNISGPLYQTRDCLGNVLYEL
uniref:Uncharacterized protein n=1 Tax=Panagrolaimus sp. PS1159 TaxID=55785 RepID=A0AC35GU87_9BILA